MIIACKNHPEQDAKRKCHYCKAPICSTCQLKIAHHIYCSKSCYYRELLKSVVDSTKKLYLYIRGKKFFNFRNILDTILILGFILSLLFAVRNYMTIRKINSDDKVFSIPIAELTQRNIEHIAKRVDTLTVFSPYSGEMIVRNRFDIEGETENNRIVTITVNGDILEAKVVKGRRFTFTDIVAKPGQNHFIVRSMNEDGSSTILEEIKFFYGTPSFMYLSRDFVRGDLENSKIALTFDGGYLSNTTEEILDILHEEEISATMFLTGIFIRKYPELVKKMVEEGHVIGNHTWTHPHLTTFAQNGKHITLDNVTRELVQGELLKTAELFEELTGDKMSLLWRAPYGEHNAEIRRWAAEAGFKHVGWTVGKSWEEGMDTMDWVSDKESPGYHTAEEILEKILAFGNGKKAEANGTIILMHLGSERIDDYPHKKLPMIIDQLMKKGYQFVTILDML